MNEVSCVQAVKKSTQMELYKRLYRAKDYIDSCYEEEINIPQLANVCWLNQSYFLRQFKKYFRISPFNTLFPKEWKRLRECWKKKHSCPLQKFATRSDTAISLLSVNYPRIFINHPLRNSKVCIILKLLIRH